MSKTDEIYRFVAKKITQLSQKGSWQTAALAKLRRGVGKTPGSVPDIWDITLENLPQELASKQGEPSYGEWAAYLSLTFFALHQQGKAGSMYAKGNSFGRAISFLRGGNNEAGIKRRFDAALTSKNIKEFSYHARGLIQLMKAKDIGLDYPLFAEGLYWFQVSDKSHDRVCLRWAEDYYRVNNKKES